MNTGIINYCDSMKGFGFIRREKGRDLIFSFSDIINSNESIISKGLKVSFECVKTNKGERAINIAII